VPDCRRHPLLRPLVPPLPRGDEETLEGRRRALLEAGYPFELAAELAADFGVRVSIARRALEGGLSPHAAADLLRSLA
jgi:hypothetical protein